MKMAERMRSDQMVLINMSGRGDKDVQTLAAIEGMSL
jgi:tryptophan synthase beta chain